MSADSLNASPLKIQETILSPIDDRTYNREDDKESNCERISQVSPYLVSPTTDTSAPDTSDTVDTRVSTSKTTLPTDAKHSKPETQCLSKATSIDSWCSNDTLYNVEENFDDLASDPDCPVEFEKDEGNSDSTDTLTHNDEAQDLSHCSTYIVHDSKSENCETFSPDSITANDNHTYTKVKTEMLNTPSATDVNDSTKNSTKDLAYGTLMSGMPSFSNCTTEIASGLEDAWKQPELIRRSPNRDNVTLSPSKHQENIECSDECSPKTSDHNLKKMDSVEISCLQDTLPGTGDNPEENQDMIVTNDSPNDTYRNMTPYLTSTPILEVTVDGENAEAIPMQLPEVTDTVVGNLSNFQRFQLSAENSTQDLYSNAAGVSDKNEDTEVLLEGDSKTLNVNSYSMLADSSHYSDFEISANTKPQNTATSISSEEFTRFENSVRNCPQDLSSLIDASSLLLNSERISGELAISSISGIHNQTSPFNSVHNQTSPSNSVHNQTSLTNGVLNRTIQTSSVDNQSSQSNSIDSQTSDTSKLSERTQSLPLSPPTVTNLIESHDLVHIMDPPNLLINFGPEDETEQPHSIIVTEVPISASIISPNNIYDSHSESHFNQTYDSHQNSRVSKPNKNFEQPKINGEVTNNEIESLISIEQSSKSENVETVQVQSKFAIDLSLTETTPSKSATDSSLTKNVPSKSATDISLTKEVPSKSTTDLSLTETVPAQSATDLSLTENVATKSATDLSLTKEVPTKTTTDLSLTETVPTQSAADLSLTENVPTKSFTDLSLTKEVPSKSTTDLSLTERAPSKSATDLSLTETVPSKSATDLSLTKKEPSKNARDSCHLYTLGITGSTESQYLPNGSLPHTASKENVSKEITKTIEKVTNDIKVNGNGVNIATVNFISETFEELLESNVDDGDCKDDTTEDQKSETQTDEVGSPTEDTSQKSAIHENISPIEDKSTDVSKLTESLSEVKTNGESVSHKVVTEDFLRNEKRFSQLDSYLPLLSDIRFTGPATEIMSTSFSQDSPTEPTSPECEQDSKPNTVAEILKEWDSDSDSHSSNSSSGEFIWKVSPVGYWYSVIISKVRAK
ncbi:putative serine/threonine-protein kinase [Operophtera brumata]|uniref:Putative serine/threonine-protein kinase n=1 Tax=Operophtera brumata TaxID=104452 RepID=A0A0L7LWQ0_OPEBR|nr:putative serine/threonine-protein kinase [Operophtera brumata]